MLKRVSALRWHLGATERRLRTGASAADTRLRSAFERLERDLATAFRRFMVESDSALGELRDAVGEEVRAWRRLL